VPVLRSQRTPAAFRNPTIKADRPLRRDTAYTTSLRGGRSSCLRLLDTPFAVSNRLRRRTCRDTCHHNHSRRSRTRSRNMPRMPPQQLQPQRCQPRRRRCRRTAGAIVIYFKTQQIGYVHGAGITKG
jgi:hypothetical protein